MWRWWPITPRRIPEKKLSAPLVCVLSWQPEAAGHRRARRGAEGGGVERQGREHAAGQDEAVGRRLEPQAFGAREHRDAEFRLEQLVLGRAPPADGGPARLP